MAVLTSLPGIGRTTLAILLAEASGPLSRRDYAALRTLAWLPSRSAAGNLTSSPCAMQPIRDYAMRCFTGRGLLSRTMPTSEGVTANCVNAATRMAAPSVVSPIGCLGSLASCSSGKQYSILSTVDSEAVNQHPSLCSAEYDIPPSRPASGKAPRAGVVQDAAKRHRRRAPARSVLDIASTALCCCKRSGRASLQHRPNLHLEG